jgi:hypothetical protein
MVVACGEDVGVVNATPTATLLPLGLNVLTLAPYTIH